MHTDSKYACQYADKVTLTMNLKCEATKKREDHRKGVKTGEAKVDSLKM